MKRKISLLMIVFLLQMLAINDVAFADTSGNVWPRLGSPPGKIVNVSFENLYQSGLGGWIGTVIKYSDNQYYLIEKKPNNETTGNIFFNVPLMPGYYFFREYVSTSDGQVVGLAFSERCICVCRMKAVFSNIPEIITAGEQMAVGISGISNNHNTWVGIVPYEPDHIYDPDLLDKCTYWQSIGTNSSASVNAYAPDEPGLYRIIVLDLIRDQNIMSIASSHTFGVAPENATQEDLESTQALLSHTNISDLTPNLPQISTDSNLVLPAETGAVNLAATPGNNNVRLTWSAAGNTQGLTGYYIFRADSPGAYSSTPLTDFPINALNYTDSTVTNGSTYYYVVSPVYGTTIQDTSNEVVAAPCAPGAADAAGAAGSITMVLVVGDPIMTVNGGQKEIDPGYGTAPVIVNGRTFVPIRAIIEELGGSIDWDGSQRMITINQNNTVINLRVDSTHAMVNGVGKDIDAAPFISSTNRTMVPLRFIIENLGYETVWDGTTKTITICKGNDTADVAATQPLTSQNETIQNQDQTVQTDFSGSWYSELGVLQLTQNGNNVYGSYEMYTGVINGKVSGNKLTATWDEEDTGNSGTLEFNMAGDKQSFDGYYQQQGDNQRSDRHGFLLPAMQGNRNWTGFWDTDNGYMILRQSGNQVNGLYDLEGNTSIKGTVSGDTLSGTWSEGNNSGTFEFTMETDGNSFSGFSCNYNDPEDAEPWGWGGNRTDY